MKAVLLTLSLLLLCWTSLLAQEESKQEEYLETAILPDQMPRFPGCENSEANLGEKKRCADQKLMEYIYSQLQYPAAALRDSIEGIAVVSFTVTTTGEITDVTIVRDPGGGTGEEAKRIVETMQSMPQRWAPAKSRERVVPITFNLPIRFKLD